MKKHGLIISTLFLLTVSVANAQLTTRFLSIPSSGFTPRSSEGFSASSLGVGYNGNRTGTARLFEESFLMFASVNLPHGATVTSMRCGGRAPDPHFRIIFSLRRNQPQQANVDIATVMTTFEGNGFQFVNTSSMTSPLVNNARFNYYIVAEADPGFRERSSLDSRLALCENCSVGFCRIGYTFGVLRDVAE